MNDIEYKSLSPLRARGVQRLALQDLRLGHFPHPEKIANPNDPKLVSKGFMTIKSYPGEYIGAFSHFDLKGYMKIGEWNTADDLEYIPLDAESSTPQLKLGIFGLVVSNRMGNLQQVDIACNLLDMATDKGLQIGASAIHIVFHEHDPIRKIAVNHDYRFTGRKGEVKNVPGVVQDLYSKRLIDTSR